MSRELFKEILSDVGAELSRLGVQGQMELASAIFNGDAFVPYGPGQITPEPESGQPRPGGAADRAAKPGHRNVAKIR